MSDVEGRRGEGQGKCPFDGQGVQGVCRAGSVFQYGSRVFAEGVTGAVVAPGVRLWCGCGPTGEAVDVFAVVAVEFDEGAEGVVSEVEFVDESGDVFFPCADVGEAGRHADLAQEGAEGVDAGAGCGFGVGEVHVASPDTDGELC